MVDVHARPWSAIGQINNNAYGRCTGTLIARDAVVTAAHCLFNKATGRFLPPPSIHFVLGYERGTYVFHSLAAAVRMGAGYDPLRPKDTIAADFAVIRLAQPAPASVEPLLPAAQKPEAGSSFTSAGFGRDRLYALTVASPCRYRPDAAPFGMILAECSIVEGYSGGPLLDAADEIAGIQVAGGRRDGRDVLLAVPASVWGEAARR